VEKLSEPIVFFVGKGKEISYIVLSIQTWKEGRELIVIERVVTNREKQLQGWRGRQRGLRVPWKGIETYSAEEKKTVYRQLMQKEKPRPSLRG